MMGHNKFIMYLLIAVLAIVCASESKAQYPLEIALFSESTGVPFSGGPALKPLHPGVQIGTGIPLGESDHHKTYLTISLKYLFHKHLFNAIAVSADIGYDYKLDFGMSLKSGIGIGYMHTFSSREVHQFIDGIYVNLPDKGNPRFTPALSLGLGYRFSPADPSSAEVFVKRQYWLEIPYSPGFIPLLPHINSVVGAKFY